MEIIQPKDLANFKGKWTKKFLIQVSCEIKTSSKCKGIYNITYSMYHRHTKNSGKIKCKECGQIGKYRYTIKDNYFDNIDTHNKAYILGLLYADGSVDERRIRLTLQEKDKHILEEIKEELGYSGNIRIISHKKMDKWQNTHNSQNFYVIEITCSPYLCKALIDIGFDTKKKRLQQLPEIDEQYFWSFMRGFFDGDGCISSYKNKHCYTTTWQVRISSIISEFKSILQDKLLDYGITSYTSSKHLIIKAKSSVALFLNYIYENSELKFNRKYNTAIICLEDL